MKTKLSKVILRYWLYRDSFDEYIRVEWRGADGVTRTSRGKLRERRYYKDIGWTYDVPPDEISELALECLLDANEYGVDGCEFMGDETPAQMDAAVEGDALAEAA